MQKKAERKTSLITHMMLPRTPEQSSRDKRARSGEAAPSPLITTALEWLPRGFITLQVVLRIQTTLHSKRDGVYPYLMVDSCCGLYSDIFRPEQEEAAVCEGYTKRVYISRGRGTQ